MNVVGIKKELKQMAPEFAARVQPIYQLLGWKWTRDSDEPFVPQVSHILDALLDLVEGIDEDFSSETSGGLEVFYSDPTPFGLCGYYGFRFKFDDFVIWGQGGKTRFVSASNS